MTQRQNEEHLIDRGGRRRIKDRRFRISILQASERRTGWKRRNGLDRRYKHLDIIDITNRRAGLIDPSIA